MREIAPAAGVPAQRRTLIQRAIEVTVSLVLLFLALRGARLADLWDAIRRASIPWLLVVVGITVAILVLKGWRWQLLFYPEYRLPFDSVFTALCAGYLASNVLPARAGELVRLVLLAGEQPVSVARTFSTIVIERVLDVLSLLLVLAALLPFLTVEMPPEVVRGAQAGVVVVLLGSVTVAVLSSRKALLMRWAHAILGRVRFLNRPGIFSALENLIDGFAALRSRLGLLLVLMSVAGWIGVVIMAWAAAQAIDLSAPLTGITFAVVVVTLSMLVPSSPGYIGVFHYFVPLALAPFGVPWSAALGLALIWHGVNYLTMSASGVVALWVHGTSLSQVLRWRSRADELGKRGADGQALAKTPPDATTAPDI